MTKKFLFMLMGAVAFASCNKFDLNYDEKAAEEAQKVKDNVTQIFGVSFPSTQDWCTATSGTIKVYVNGTDNITKVQVLLSEVTDSVSNMRLLNQKDVKDGDEVSFAYDVPSNYDNLFVAFIDNTGKYFFKKFTLNDKEIYYKNNSARRALSQDYTLPTNPTISGTVETFANKRNWIPGEVFYVFDNQAISSNDYDDDFKSIFRRVIFNYFPNGRSYNNIEKLKSSSFFNETAYPITTGKEPIIVTPVYKNDGGYHEISEAELYYYYFKGNLNAQEVEALPKYKAIDLSEVYKNDDNDKINKSKSYALAYFGDGIPEIGTKGSYQFPDNYKIGFCYKSNTETDNKRKQGELYGDGRLNYNINKWGNFSSSKLGPTDPRMGWVSINDKTFLCVESGTDADINDLIIDIEGGIEIENIMPIEIEQQFYTFCFEDNKLGDYDMNDVVLKGTRIDETHVEYTLMACGAMDHLYIHNIEGEHIKSSIEVHDLFNKQNQFINTTKGDHTPYITDVIVVDKSFSFLNELTQPYIFDKDKSWIIKISRKGEDPHAIMIPYDFKWPLERICIKDAYSKFNEWGQGLVTDTDWYKYPVEGKYYE